MDSGSMLGGYRIERPLGRGGMGAVFLAYDTTLHRPVALKVVGGDSESGRRQSLREARNAAALNHPNICTIHEVGQDGDAAFIAMEYVEGRSLRDRLDEAGRLPQPEALRYAMQAADALAHAHQHGVVHRDLKAANVMVSSDGRVKVVDFGLARRDDPLIADATTLMSVAPAGAAVGTPYAMAPEQVRGEAADPRTDVWALGVLLFELLTGRRPFAGDTVPELFSAILKDPPQPWPSHVASAIRPVVERCLEKDPGRRYQHAGEVRAVLESIDAGLTPIWVTWRYQLTRRRWPAALAAVVIIAAAAVPLNVGGLRDRLMGTDPANSIKLAVLPFDNLTGDPDQEFLSDGLTDETISQLGRIAPQQLSVVARTSTMPYKAREVPVEQIARELGVQYLLEGSTRREGSRIRIGVTLIRASDQSPVWSDTFDRELTSVLTLQQDVARGVSGALAVRIVPALGRRAAAQPVNPESYEAYLRGASHLDRLTRPEVDIALKYFQQALEKDPANARAWIGVFRVWATRQQLIPSLRRDADQPRRAALAKAIEIDPDLPEIQSALAAQAVADWDWEAADRAFRRALDLNPSDAGTRAFYSQFLNQMKRPAEALAQIERAMAVDPLSAWVQTLYGLALNNANRPEEAIVQFENVLRTTPDSSVALSGLGGALTRLGRTSEALKLERKEAAARGDVALEEAFGREDGAAEAKFREAIAALEARAASGAMVNEVQIALMHLRVKDLNRALDWLERAYDSHNPNLPSINNRRPFDPLRSHPRFQALLQRMRLPQ